MGDLFTISEAAAKVGCSPSFIYKRCKEGAIPSVRIGTNFRIDPAALTAWLQGAPAAVQLRQRAERRPEEGDDVLDALDAWARYLSHVRAFSPRTTALYHVLARSYLKRMAASGRPPLTLGDLFERRAVVAVFAKIPAGSYSTKMNTYLMLRSLGAFLIAEGKVAADVLEPLTTLKPRRQVEPRRTSLKPDQVSRLFDYVLTRRHPPAENLTFAAMIACMAHAGLRASEVCNLRASHVDLAERVLTVIHGKGGKNRRVGISAALHGYLADYERIRPASALYFQRADDSAWTKDHVGKRLRVASRRLGFHVTAHALRRTFATSASAQGRSVNALRIALGHTSLETTLGYLRTTEAEVVREMATW